MTESPLTPLRRLVVCPVCNGGLEYSTGSIACISCGRYFPQASGEYIDLVPPRMLKDKENQREVRQQEMEDWYEDLITDPAAAADSFARGYTPYASLLAELSGEVLEAGGGIGIVREYLPGSTEYTVIDPSLGWLDSECASLTDRFPSLNKKPRFVRGVGEIPAHPSDQGWPLQSDHDRIRESDLQTWISQRFKIAWREWIIRYLTFVLRKIEPLEDAQTERAGVEARQEQDSLSVLLEERGQFVRRLQTYEQQLGEAKSALVEERRRTQRLRKRIQGLNQQTHVVQGFRIRRLVERLGRNRFEDRRID